MEILIKKLITEGYLKSQIIIKAFKKIKREDFLPTNLKSEAGANTPLPIGYKQTISQPLTVAFMLELLEPRVGQKILDIGSGSGWTSALLAEIVGPKGRVYAIDRIPELVKFGRRNAMKYNFKNLEFICADGSLGLPRIAPFDRIQVAAAAEIVPADLKTQLKINGRLVIPTQANDIRLFERVNEKELKETVFPGFVFVPLIIKTKHKIEND